MKRTVLATLLMVGACAASPMQQSAETELMTPAAARAADAPSSPATLFDGQKLANRDAADEEAMRARRANYAEAMLDVAERQKVFAGEPSRFSLSGSYAQGGLVFGETEPGATVRVDGEEVMVGADGRFVAGFGRDSAKTALFVVTLPDGVVERQTIEIEDREFPVQRIDGLDQSKVSGFTEEQLAKIAADSAKKKAARQKTEAAALWAAGFEWPITGRISGVFGSQRILNGEPKRPHSGVDVAAPNGAAVRAPAPGVVTLAEEGMYFEGGLILIDHGHWLESAFLHLSQLDVKPGQRVEKGDIIGRVGATGRATGPHLHWSMKWAGRLVDPQLTVGDMPASAPASGN